MILIFPKWRTQPWYLAAIRMGTKKFTFRPREDLLKLAHNTEAVYTSLCKAVDFNGDTDRVTKTGKKILDGSIRASSMKKYETYWTQWNSYCSNNGIVSASAMNIVNFLGELYDHKLSYSTIKVAKSAFGHIVELAPYRSIGDHPMIFKFMKRLFNLNLRPK